MQRGQRPWLPSSKRTGRSCGLLPAGLWPLDSKVVIGRSKVNPEVIPTGYGRPRGDDGAYPVDSPMISRPAGRALARQCGCGSVGTAWRDAVGGRSAGHRRTAAGRRRTAPGRPGRPQDTAGRPPDTAGRRRTAARRPGRPQDTAGRPPDTAGWIFHFRGTIRWRGGFN